MIVINIIHLMKSIKEKKGFLLIKSMLINRTTTCHSNLLYLIPNLQNDIIIVICFKIKQKS